MGQSIQLVHLFLDLQIRPLVKDSSRSSCTTGAEAVNEHLASSQLSHEERKRRTSFAPIAMKSTLSPTSLLLFGNVKSLSCMC